MPIYEYECRGCHHGFELLVLKGTIPACPSCQGEDLERLPSGFAVSTEEMSRMRVARAKQQIKRSKNWRDSKIADAEHEHEHVTEYMNADGVEAPKFKLNKDF